MDPSLMVPPAAPAQLLQHPMIENGLGGLLAGVQKDKGDQKAVAVKRVVKKCEHNRQKSQCKDCRGSGICPHNRQRRLCKDCEGSGECPIRARLVTQNRWRKTASQVFNLMTMLCTPDACA